MDDELHCDLLSVFHNISTNCSNDIEVAQGLLNLLTRGASQPTQRFDTVHVGRSPLTVLLVLRPHS